MRRKVTKKQSTRSARRFSVTTVIVALTILAVGAVSVASRQKLSAKASASENADAAVSSVQNSPNPTRLNQSSDEDREKLAAGLKEVINQSTEGLTEVHHADGSVSLNLEDRFQNVSVAKVSNGKLSQACLDNPQSAGAFFSIDPKLIDNKTRAQVAPVTQQ